MIKQILVKDESSEYDLSYRVYTPCSHWKTHTEVVEVAGGEDTWLRCDSCELVLESLNDLRYGDYDRGDFDDYDHE